MVSLPEDQRDSFVAKLTPSQAAEILYDWTIWARPNQLPAPAFLDDLITIWFCMCGRGWGKTSVGAQATVEAYRRGYGNMALIGRTPADVRDVMIEGPSGILLNTHPQDRPKYEPTKRLLTFPNGAKARTFSGANPEQLRGPQHDFVWGDELAAWDYPSLTWDNMMLGLRMGRPKAVITSTPKPIQVVRDILAREDVLLTRGSTYDNIENLPVAFAEFILSKYENTTTGQQEILGLLLEEAEGALWKRALITANRIDDLPNNILRRVVAIDIATTSNEDSDETGIVGAAVDDRTPPHGYIIADASGRYSPEQWASRGINLMRSIGGDRLIGETNQGGDLIATTLRIVDPNVSYKGVHASQGKNARAEPIVALYEQGRIHHVGAFAELEDQLCTWEPMSGDKSPDRLDALVWALTELMLGTEWSII